MDKEKAVFTTVEAEAMDAFMRYHKDNALEGQIRLYLADSRRWVNTYHPLHEMGFDKFVQALIFGYEVKLTKEEKLKMAFDTAIPAGPINLPYGDAHNKNAFRDGVLTALRIMGISVEGVYMHGEVADGPKDVQTD